MTNATNVEILTAEDAAMKAKVEGLQLPAPRESSGAIDVGVWFRWPQREYADNLFPFITVDLLEVQVDHEREHSYQYDSQTYLVDTFPTAQATPVTADVPFPTPVTYLYLVATHCRSALHDRTLHRKLLRADYLPLRFGSLYVPEDDTLRRLDVLDIAESNEYDTLQKRVFRRMFTIGVSGEITPEPAFIIPQSIDDVIFDPTSSEDRGLADPNFPIS